MRAHLLFILFSSLILLAPHVEGLEANASPSPENKAISDSYDKAQGAINSFFGDLASQKEVSHYTTDCIVGRLLMEPFFLNRLQKQGYAVTGFQTLVKDRLDTVVFFADHSQEEPLMQAIIVAQYLSNIMIFQSSIDHNVVADECIRLIPTTQHHMLSVPLFYYATYVAGKQVPPPKSLDSNQKLKVVCEVLFKPKTK